MPPVVEAAIMTRIAESRLSTRAHDDLVQIVFEMQKRKVQAERLPVRTVAYTQSESTGADPWEVVYSREPLKNLETNEALRISWNHVRVIGQFMPIAAVSTQASTPSSTLIGGVASIGRTSAGASRPQSKLGKRLRAIRAKYVAGGGELLSIEQIRQDVAERRGELAGEEEG